MIYAKSPSSLKEGFGEANRESVKIKAYCGNQLFEQIGSSFLSFICLLECRFYERRFPVSSWEDRRGNTPVMNAGNQGWGVAGEYRISRTVASTVYRRENEKHRPREIGFVCEISRAESTSKRYVVAVVVVSACRFVIRLSAREWHLAMRDRVAKARRRSEKVVVVGFESTCLVPLFADPSRPACPVPSKYISDYRPTKLSWNIVEPQRGNSQKCETRVRNQLPRPP